MSAETTHDATPTQESAPRAHWTGSQRRTAVAIALGFAVGLFMTGVVGPIVLTVVIGLLQGYHRF